jgi:hypothetical protein
MMDESTLIQKTFEEYAEAFQALEPKQILPFFHYPVMLIAPDKVAVVRNPIMGYFGFKKVMKELKQRCFTRSYAESLQVQQLSENLAIVTGVVIRLKQCNGQQEMVLECFDLNYTLRKVKGHWKITVGVLTETTRTSLPGVKVLEPSSNGA